MFVTTKTTKFCPMQKEKKPMEPNPHPLYLTITSVAGIVSKELQGHKWRLNVHRRNIVVDTFQAG